MTQRALKVGDPVLFYGHNLEVVGLEDKPDATGQVWSVAVVEEPGARARRDAAIAEIRKLREVQTALEPHMHREHFTLAEQIRALGPLAMVPVVRIRVDLLAYWEERGVWVSDGRILSDAQTQLATKRFGQKPKPHAQRAVLDLLAPMEA